MANWILGHTDRFECIVSHDSMFNAESTWGSTEELWFDPWEFKGTRFDPRALYQKWSSHPWAKNFKTPTLVIHGQLDHRLDGSEGFLHHAAAHRRFRRRCFPDERHRVLKPQNSQLCCKTVNDWVDPRWKKVVLTSTGRDAVRRRHSPGGYPSAERCAPVSNSNPERNAQNIRLTESENGPYTSAKFSFGRARM